MDRDLIVGQLMNRCKCVIEHIVEAADLQTVATASIAIFEQMREVARAMLQATVDLEAAKRIGNANGILAPMSGEVHPRRAPTWTQHRSFIPLPTPAGKRTGFGGHP